MSISAQDYYDRIVSLAKVARAPIDKTTDDPEAITLARECLSHLMPPFTKPITTTYPTGETVVTFWGKDWMYRLILHPSEKTTQYKLWH